MSNGRIIVAGHYWNGTNNDIALVGYNSDGSLDNTFGSSGIVTTAIGSDNEYCLDVAVQPDGKVVAVGSVQIPFTWDFAAVRYLTSLNVGILDFASNNSILVYPNPIVESTTLEFILTKPEKVSIYLTDMQGKIIQTYTDDFSFNEGKNSQNIIMPEYLTSGSYFITLSTSSSALQVKIVK